MKEDYLWDKTGEDAAIEQLENALKAFRYAETAPPVIPEQVFEAKRERPRRFFHLGFAFAAFAAVAVICFAVWFQFANNKIPALESAAETSAPSSDEKAADKPFEKEPEVLPAQDIENPKRFSQPKVIRIRQQLAPRIRPNKAFVRKTNVKAPTETLTAEEKYAYDQLMLALSITSSKLKIVKDKVEGIEEQNAVLDTAK